MSISEVVPEKIPGYWIYSDDVKQGKKRDSKAGLPVYPPKQGEKVILSFHGGSYVGGTAHPNDFVSTIVKNILRHTHRSAAPTSQQQQEAKPYAERALCVEYRLSSGAPLQPSNPFPAALLDAIAAYHYLIHTVGFSPSDIIVEGDSAGGNLAIALTRYLVEKQIELAEEGLKPPGALLLLSPWADIGSSHDVEVPKSWLARWFASFQLKADYDPPPHGMDYAKCAFVGPYGMGGANTNRYISPGSISPFAHVNFLPPGQSPYAVTVESNSSKDLAEWPRVFLSAGGTENLLPQIHVLRNRMFRDLGEDRSAQGWSIWFNNGAHHDIDITPANTDPTNVNGNTRLTPSTGKVRYMEAPDVPHDFLLFPWMDPERTETLEAIGSWASVRTFMLYVSS